jgi:hypothetical protein
LPALAPLGTAELSAIALEDPFELEAATASSFATAEDGV